MTQNVLQNAKTLTKVSIFGDPNVNVQYMTGLCSELEGQGHSFKVMEKDARSVKQVLQRLVVTEEALRLKNKGIKMTAGDKMDFLKAWSVKHAEMLDLGGLGDVADGAPTPKFCSGVFFSPNFVHESLPHLQQTFQADASHMGFGKW